MNTFIRLIRPRQWSKNSLVFAALIFSQRYGNLDDWLHTLLTFAVFSIVASGIYIYNDIRDVDDDRLHPIKRNRPIASGEVNISTAYILAVVLLIGGLVPGWLLGRNVFIVLLGYEILMVLYSHFLKHVLILDVFIIAGGLTMRVVAGAEAIAVEMSHWLLVCAFFISLTLALAKRRQELARIGDNRLQGRKSLHEAPPVTVWDRWVAMVSGITILAYTLYTVDPVTVTKVGSANLLFTMPFVAFAIFRYQILIYRESMGEDPTELLLRDRWIMLTVLGWLIVVLIVLMQG